MQKGACAPFDPSIIRMRKKTNEIFFDKAINLGKENRIYDSQIRGNPPENPGKDGFRRLS